MDETAGDQHLSIPPSYQAADPRYRRPSYPRSELSASYLQSGFDPSNYSRNSSSESFINPLRASPAPAFGISDSDPLTFQIDPETANFHVQTNPSEPAILSRTDMSSFAFSPDPLGGNYREQGSYNSSRSTSMRGDYPFSSTEASQRRTSSTSSSYDVGSNLGSAPYGRTNSVSSTHGPYMGSISASPTAYNEMNYQAGYGLENVNPQTMYNPSQDPGLPSMTTASHQGYRSRRPSAAPSVSSIPDEPIRILETRSRPQCWEHGCNGRQFSTFSNLLRHQREKSGTATKSYCPRCGAEFTRTTARNGHLAHDKCTKRLTDDQ